MAAATQPPPSSARGWMPAPQLGPQGGYPLSPLLAAGPHTLAQKAAQRGQHPPGQQQQLDREPFRLREAFRPSLPHQTAPVAPGLLRFFRQSLAACYHGADLPLALLPGADRLPHVPAAALFPVTGLGGGRLLPLRDQRLHGRGGRSSRLRPRRIRCVVRLFSSQALAAAAGLPGVRIHFFHMFAHIVSVKAQTKWLQFVTICNHTLFSPSSQV